jgi:hypothetical protein
MTRAELKKQLGIYRPSLIRPEMFTNISESERNLMRMEERAWLDYEREKLAIYDDKSLTDEQRRTLWTKASDRRWAAMDKLRPLRKKCDRMHERRMIKMLSLKTTRPAASSRVRVAA